MVLGKSSRTRSSNVDLSKPEAANVNTTLIPSSMIPNNFPTSVKSFMPTSFKTANGSSARIDRHSFSSSNKKKLSSNPDLANKNKIRNSNVGFGSAATGHNQHDNNNSSSLKANQFLKSAGSNGNLANSNYFINSSDLPLQMEELKITK